MTSGYTWDEAVSRYLDEKSHKASIREDKRALEFFQPHFAGMDLMSVTRRAVDDVIAKHLKGRSDYTKRNYVAIVRGMMNLAYSEWEWIEKVPPYRTYNTDSNPREKFLDPASARKLIEELPQHLKVLCIFSLASGLRQANARDLEWYQVDWANRSVTIPAKRFKTRKALTIPLNDVAMDILSVVRGEHPTRVFTYRRKPFKQVNTKAWRKALKRAGITDFTWHGLRHTWASWMAQRGVPETILQSLGGWSSLDMVKRYSHLNVRHLAPYAAQAGEVLKTGETLTLSLDLAKPMKSLASPG